MRRAGNFGYRIRHGVARTVGGGSEGNTARNIVVLLTMRVRLKKRAIALVRSAAKINAILWNAAAANHLPKSSAFCVSIDRSLLLPIGRELPRRADAGQEKPAKLSPRTSLR